MNDRARSMQAWFAVFLLASALPAAVRAEENPKLGVFEFQANGATPQLASTVAGMVANHLEGLGLFRVMTSESIGHLIALDRQRQLMGCATGPCDGLNLDLGVEYVVTGKLSGISGSKELPTALTLELTLLDARQGARVSSDVQTGLTEAELIGKLSKSVHKLVSRILKERAGWLLVTTAEAGASVRVDDVLVGTTPLPGRIALPGGPHFVQVDKKGFVMVQKEVRIQPSQLTEETFTLVPSPDFIRDYEASASRTRLGAYLASGAAVAGLLAAGYFQYRSASLYGAPDVAGTFAYHRSKLNSGIETEDGVDHRQAALDVGARLSTAQRLSYVSAGAGCAALVTAAVFWVTGDEPGRYDRFKALTPKVALVPSRGGALTSFALSF